MLKRLSNLGVNVPSQCWFQRVFHTLIWKFLLYIGVKVSFGFRCQASFYISMLMFLLSFGRKAPFTIVILMFYLNSDVKVPLRFDFKFLFERPFFWVRVTLTTFLLLKTLVENHFGNVHRLRYQSSSFFLKLLFWAWNLIWTIAFDA